MQDVPVEVAVRFAGTAARPRDLVNLQVGDVLPLKHNTGDPLTVTAADIVFAHAVPGAAGKRLAVLVVESPENSNPLKPEEPA
nr:FliM/FliN family flagellar motor C-terminal domain-containing protein [Motilibacter aurantiacus]